MTCCLCYRLPKIVFFPRTRDLLVSRKTTWIHFFPRPPSPFLCNFCKRNCSGICIASHFTLGSTSIVIHSVKQRLRNRQEVAATTDLSWLTARKITKRVYSCKPASMNCPIGYGYWTRVLNPLSLYSVEINENTDRGTGSVNKRDEG